MDTNKILSANILDLIFDDRNKEYGAYQLRRTYPRRITKALLITATIAFLAFTGSVFGNSHDRDKKLKPDTKEITLENLKEEEEPEPLPPPEQKPEPIQQKTVQFTEPVLVKEETVDPPPEQADFTDAKIDVMTQDGVPDEGISDPDKTVGEGKGVIEKIDKEPDLPFTSVEIDAKYEGNWEKFLRQNLNGYGPAENGAPPGRYTVVIQFVVDIDGSLSDIKALTAHGYGMEEEAIRVIKKSKKWEPAYQNKTHVKAYRKQPIIFEVME